MCHYLYHCVIHVLFVVRLNVNLIILSKFIYNNILRQRIFWKNLNRIRKTFLPKKSNFNSASMFILSSLSNDVSPAKKCVLILGKNDRRILFLIALSFQKPTPAKTSPFFASYKSPIFLFFCSRECFFSYVQSYWSVNLLIHSAASLHSKCFP